MRYVLGMDVSTSVVGFAVMDLDMKLKAYDKIKFKSDLSLEERAEFVRNKVKHFNQYYFIDSVYVEQPAMLFGRGKTTANTLAKLQRFNGMCCYVVYEELKLIPGLLHANTARKKMNIKVPRNVKNKKHYIIAEVVKKYPNFTFNLTRYGNPQPGTDDMADAIVVAYAGVSIENEEENVTEGKATK